MKMAERVENTVGKGEIAHYEQFLLFQQRFQKTQDYRQIKRRPCLEKDQDKFRATFHAETR